MSVTINEQRQTWNNTHEKRQLTPEQYSDIERDNEELKRTIKENAAQEQKDDQFYNPEKGGFTRGEFEVSSKKRNMSY